MYRKSIAVGYTFKRETGKTADIEDVHMIIPHLERAVTYCSANRGKGSSKLPVCGAVANFIAKNSEVLGNPIFVGFDTADFLRMLGLGCAKAQVYLSPELWLPDDKQVGIDLSFPDSDVTTEKLLPELGEQFSGEDKKSFDKLIKDWKPFKDAERDGKLSFLVGSMFRVWG
jgi:hypothetical protein